MRVSPQGARSRGRRPRRAAARAALHRLDRLMRAVSAAQPEAIDAAARELAGSKRYLAPLAWAAGTIGLMLTGIKLLLFNWRLSLLELVPAFWVWLAMWDLKQHFLHGMSFHRLNIVVLVCLAAGIVLFTVLALWCNTVFAFAIDGPAPPRISPAVRQARARAGSIVRGGLVIGTALAGAAVVVPLLGRLWLFGTVLGAVVAVMVTAFVAVPARIIGVQPVRPPLKQRIGGLVAGGALSAVVMAPGYLLDRLGLILLGLHRWHVVGLALLSLGAGLYAAGMSSVKAVTLSSKLVGSPPGPPAEEA